MIWNSPVRSSRGIPKSHLISSPPAARILLLEDEVAVRDALAEALARHGYQVLVGTGLEDGLRVLQGLGWSQLDLVLTDSHLSRDEDILNGHVFHLRWRALYPVPPFIFMNGWGDPLDRVSPLERSCQVYTLAKPFPFTVLLGLIRAVLGR